MSEFELEDVEQLVKAALSGGDAQAALVSINEKCQQLRAAVDGGPVMKVNPERYQAADKLTKWSRSIAFYLADKEQPHLEEVAWQLRASPILSIHGQHRHMVGPAMLDWADCNKRIGNDEKANTLYQAVINDFVILLHMEPAPNTEWFTSLESLKKALENHSGDHNEQITRVKERLNQWQEAVS